MTVDTGKPVATKAVVRRTLEFHSYDEILECAHKLSQMPTKQLGNWTLGQICRHVALGMDEAIDGPTFRAAWPLRLIGPLVKNRFLSRPMPSGFKIPKKGAALLPTPTDTEVGLQLLERSIQRLKQTSIRQPHGLFGKMTSDDWDALQFRHAAMHLSFIEPA